jgi:hypothetical protein
VVDGTRHVIGVLDAHCGLFGARGNIRTPRVVLLFRFHQRRLGHQVLDVVVSVNTGVIEQLRGGRMFPGLG